MSLDGTLHRAFRSMISPFPERSLRLFTRRASNTPRYSAILFEPGYALVVQPLVALPASTGSGFTLRQSCVTTIGAVNGGFLRLKTRDTCIDRTRASTSGSMLAGTPWLWSYDHILTIAVRGLTATITRSPCPRNYTRSSFSIIKSVGSHN